EIFPELYHWQAVVGVRSNVVVYPRNGYLEETGGLVHTHARCRVHVAACVSETGGSVDRQEGVVVDVAYGRDSRLEFVCGGHATPRMIHVRFRIRWVADAPKGHPLLATTTAAPFRFLRARRRRVARGRARAPAKPHQRSGVAARSYASH